jgi:serine/threonine protein kinase
MPLSPGAPIGPYEILAPLGAGGMGEVYRARDLKLQRDVALKVLPDAVARDADRRTRFEREAHVPAPAWPLAPCWHGRSHEPWTRCSTASARLIL